MDAQEINMRHFKAMAEVDGALDALQEGQADKAFAHFRNAYDLESACAWAFAGISKVEPSRSILFRSAAALALDCGLKAEAETLIDNGLAGNPPAEIRKELLDLLTKVYAK